MGSRKFECRAETGEEKEVRRGETEKLEGFKGRETGNKRQSDASLQMMNWLSCCYNKSGLRRAGMDRDGQMEKDRVEITIIMTEIKLKKKRSKKKNG